MNIADELKKLHQLHDSGALNDEEFAKAKDAVLGGQPPARTSSTEGEGLLENIFGGKKDTLGDAANRYVSFQVVMAVVGLIIAAIFFFAFFLPNWNKAARDHQQMQQKVDRVFEPFPGR